MAAVTICSDFGAPQNSHGVLRFMGSQRVIHDWATELNWILSVLHKQLALCRKFKFCFLKLSRIKTFFYLQLGWNFKCRTRGYGPLTVDILLLLLNTQLCARSSNNSYFTLSTILYRQTSFPYTLLHFADIASFFFLVSFFFFFFNKLRVCGNPTLSKSVSSVSPTVVAHFRSLCHTLDVSFYVSNFHYHGDLRSVMLVSVMTLWMLR